MNTLLNRFKSDFIREDHVILLFNFLPAAYINDLFTLKPKYVKTQIISFSNLDKEIVKNDLNRYSNSYLISMNTVNASIDYDYVLFNIIKNFHVVYPQYTITDNVMMM